MHCPDLLISAPPLLSAKLRRQTDELLSRIVRSNYNTQFAQTASELTEFRDATTSPVDEIDDNTLSESFRKTVRFTTYDSYAPLIAKFFQKPCKASAMVDLFAPGLPDYLAKSSSTSGGVQKLFPKYNRSAKITSPDTGSRATSDPLRKRTTTLLSHFWYDPIYLEDENNCPVKTVYISSVTAMNRRMSLNLYPEEDRERMTTFLLDHTAPYAIGIIKNYRSFLLIHALFAVGSRSVETMTMVFISTFVDMMRYLDMAFDVVVDCIATGTIPNLDGIAEIRHYLEMNILPDTERATELRSLGRPSSRPGWCGYAWPNMHSITAAASGSFATYTPLARWFLGPDMDICPHGYGSTEAWIAGPYNPLESNQFKLTSEDIIEFLDINESDSIGALVQLWEAEPERRYEIVLTTRDGLWRYRLGDVVEISGFDPTDGIPIIQFVERRNVAIRFAWLMVSEEELRAAILSMAPNVIMQMVGWTTMTDDRDVPATIGFFVELADDQVSDLTLAREHVAEQLSRSMQNVALAIQCESFRKPTIRIVRPGTFSEFIQLKLDEGGSNNIGQIKVPVVLSKAEHVTWFSDQVVREL